MDRSVLFTYVVAILGAFVLAASIGGVVLGAYAPIQHRYDLCGYPEMTVFGPGEAERIARPDAPFSPVRYEALSEPARTAFEGTLDSPTNEQEVEGKLEPREREAFLDGAIVIDDGRRYYVTITPHPCTSVSVLSLPLGLVGLAIGAVALLVPVLRRRRTGAGVATDGRVSGASGGTRSVLGPFRDGPYGGAALLGSFGAATIVSLVPWVGPLLGGSIVGSVAPTIKRATIRGGYLGAIVAVVLLADAAFAGVLGLYDRGLFVYAYPLSPLVLAPIGAAVTRRLTRHL